jgi:hypothetical protein
LLAGVFTSRAEEGSAASQTLSLVWAAATQGRFSYCVAADDRGATFEAGVAEEALGNGITRYASFVAKFDRAGKSVWRTVTRHLDGSSEFDAAVVDGNGNVYAAGSLVGKDADFGNKLRLDDPRPQGREASMCRMLLVKYDGQGRALWAQTGPVRERTAIGSLAVDRSGNVFAVGFAWADAEETNGPIVFRDAAPGYRIMPYPEAIEGSVLVKFGPQGKALWAVAPGSIQFASVVADESGNAYVAGADNVDGASALGYARGVLVAGGGNGTRAMLAKYSPNGMVLWTRLATVKGGSCEFIQLARAADGSLYAAGTATGSCDFGNGVYLSAPAPQSPLLVKYDVEGKAQWARIATGPAEAWRIRAAAAMGGQVYWAIQADEPGPDANFDFGDGISLGGRVFVVCYDTKGKALWARGIPPYLDYFDPSLTFGDGSIFLFNEGSESQLDFGGGISVERRLSYIARFSVPASGSAEKPAVSAGRIAVCVDDRVRLRSAGNLEGATLGYLAKGDRVVVLERSGEKMKVGEMLDFWYRVRRLSDGLVGWCYGYYLRME